MTDHSRVRAFPTGSLDSFVGDHGTLTALASAAGIRNSLERHHVGCNAEPDALVKWSGGTCRYEDAAKISQIALHGFTRGVSQKVADDLSRSSKSPALWSQDQVWKFYTDLCSSRKWYLPQRDPSLEQEMMAAIRAELTEKDTRQKVRSAPILCAALSHRQEYAKGLTQSAEGDQGPARAFDRGEAVTVQTAYGDRDWAKVSHIDNEQMMAFNIGMADYVISAFEAMETVAFERPARRSSRTR